MGDTPTVFGDEVVYVATTPTIGIDPTDIEVEADANVIEPNPVADVATDV